MDKCKHGNIDEEGPKPYFGPVADRTENENRGAHGGVRYTDVCRDCGATREVLVNGRHSEFGPWLPPR
jgi:hypothetical protein